MTLPPHVLQKIEQEATSYEGCGTINSDGDPVQDEWAYSKYKLGATVWAERAMKLREALGWYVQNYASPEGLGISEKAFEAIQELDEEMKK